MRCFDDTVGIHDRDIGLVVSEADDMLQIATNRLVSRYLKGIGTGFSSFQEISKMSNPNRSRSVI